MYLLIVNVEKCELTLLDPYQRETDYEKVLGTFKIFAKYCAVGSIDMSRP